MSEVLKLDNNDHQFNIINNECSCSYCGISNESCLVKCEICNKWFCNGKNGVKGSHIITHLVLSKHNSISLHPNSALGDSTLECYKCGKKNIFLLGFVSAKEENVVVILCRLPCAQQKDSNWDTKEWQSLIEDRQLLTWIANDPNNEYLDNSFNINHDQIIKLENKWRIDKNFTIDKLDENDQVENIEVDPILMRYVDGFQYQRSFAPIVKIEADYDKLIKESTGIKHVSVQWSSSLNGKHLASFYFTSLDSSELNISIGDEMLLKYDSFNPNDSWEGKGFIIGLPNSHQDDYTLELMSYSNPPTNLSRFTAEIVWKGIPYERMQDALQTFALNPNSISEYLYFKLLGHEINDVFFDIKIPENLSIISPLNASQLLAVKSALKSPLTLIQGPPGTGKTVTSATIIYHINKLYPKDKMLVCAPSNIAVDHLTQKLMSMGLKIVRIVAKTKEDVDSSISSVCLHEIIKKKSNKRLKQLIELKDEIGELSKSDNKKFKKLWNNEEKKILNDCDIVCCTCVGAGDPRLDKLKFRTVLIDESTQAAEPQTLIPIVKSCKQVILVGDHQQLGAVILNKKASAAGLKQSLFERLIVLGHSPIRLEVQYRMHPALSEFPSNMFYDGSLQNGVTKEDRQIINSKFPWPIRDIPMMFWCVYGREEISSSGTSYLNRVEALNIEKIIRKLICDGVTASQIGIVTAYEGQRNYVLQYLKLAAVFPDDESYENMEISSVDAFQGREKDYIILSCVRANAQQLIGFLRDPRRLNVALTRAKYGLIILGNPKSLNKDRLWSQLLSFYRSRGCLVEGQLHNLQLSTIQLARFNKPDNNRNRFLNNINKKSLTSNASFDTSSMVSYEGSSFTAKNSITSNANENEYSNYSNDKNIHKKINEDENDNDTIISQSINSTDYNHLKDTEINDKIKKLTQQFGNDLTF